MSLTVGKRYDRILWMNPGFVDMHVYVNLCDCKHVQVHTHVKKYLLSKRKTWSDTYVHTDTQTQSPKLYHANCKLKDNT